LQMSFNIWVPLTLKMCVYQILSICYNFKNDNVIYYIFNKLIKKIVCYWITVQRKSGDSKTKVAKLNNEGITWFLSHCILLNVLLFLQFYREYFNWWGGGDRGGLINACRDLNIVCHL
jgi:hypothetical protein